MSNEIKFRKERKDKNAMPGFARAMIVLTVVQILFAFGMHIMESVQQLMIIMVGVAALVFAVLAVFGWDTMPAFRRIVRGVLIALPFVFIAAVVIFLVMAVSANPDADFSFNFLVGAAASFYNWQVINVCMLPTLVAAASFGARFDRILLSVMAILNAALVTFFVFVSTPQVDIPVFGVEETLFQWVYVLFAWVVAGLTFIPAIAGDPDHSLKTKAL